MAFVKSENNITEDQWLSQIMGKPVYRVMADNTLGENEGAIKDLQPGNVFLYAKVPVQDVTNIERLEKLQFHLVDTNVVLDKKATQDRKPSGKTIVRLAESKDEQQAVELGRRSFAFTRFHQDPAIPKEKADEIKAEWVRNYFKGTRGSHMIVAEKDNQIVGFLLMIFSEGNFELIIDLVAVDPDFQHQGIATDMIIFAENMIENVKSVKVGTQIANIPSLKLYGKLGFKVCHSAYVFHFHS